MPDIMYLYVRSVCIPEQHRYLYSTSGSHPTKPSPVQSVAKLDTHTFTQQRYQPKAYEFLGEPLFVPRRTEASAEDDGYVLTFLYDGQQNKSYLVIFDAKDISKGPIHKLLIKSTHVPLGLHGSFAEGLTYDFEQIKSSF